MDGLIHGIDLPPSEEELRSLRVFEVKKDLGTLIFQSLVRLPNGENEAEDIVERYQDQNIVKSFDDLLTLLVQSEYILRYSTYELEQFYTTHFQEPSFESCLTIFEKGPFAKSFCIAMYANAVIYPQRDILIAMRVLNKLKLIHQKLGAKQIFHPVHLQN